MVAKTDGCRRGYREVTQCFPRPGRVEHDPEISHAVHRPSREAIAAAGAAGDDRHHQPARDRGALGSPTGAPVHRAIVWQDRRRGGALRGLARGGDLARTGSCSIAYFSATQARMAAARAG